MNDPLILFESGIKKLDLDNTKQQLLQIIRKELLRLKQVNQLEIKNNKIFISYRLLVYLSKIKKFRDNAIAAHELTKILRTKKLVSLKSLLYPKNIKIFSANPMPKSFLYADMKSYENILLLRDNLIQKFKENNYTDIDIYIYARLFSTVSMKSEYITKISLTTFFKLNTSVSICVICQPSKVQEYSHIEIIFIDQILSEIFENTYIKKVSDGNLLNIIDHLFDKSNHEYEKEINKYLRNNNTNITDCHNAIDFEYQMIYSPLDLTIKNYKLSPKITLQEIDFLYPNILPKYLIEIEKRNYDYYFNNMTNLENNESQEDEKLLDTKDRIDDYCDRPIEIYDKFTKIKQLNSIQTKRDIKRYIMTWNKFINTNVGQDKILDSILLYTKLLLEKIDSDKKRKTIKLSTLQDYFSVLFNYCFNILIAYDQVDKYLLDYIKNNLFNNNELTIKSKKKNWRIVKLFIARVSNYNTDGKIEMAIDIRRSIVFPTEFKSFIHQQTVIDRDKFSNTKIAKKIKISMRSVFSILLYYSGLRKDELRTRLTKDIIQINQNEYIIYVNKKGFLEAAKLDGEKPDKEGKNKNIRRKVRFYISDDYYVKLMNYYYNYMSSKKFKFFFPKINDTEALTKKYVMEKSYFNSISKNIQKVTGRYTPTHSLRHSFTTFQLQRMLKDKKSSQDLFKLANTMGHSEVETTLTNYLHLDLIYLMNC